MLGGARGPFQSHFQSEVHLRTAWAMNAGTSASGLLFLLSHHGLLAVWVRI